MHWLTLRSCHLQRSKLGTRRCEQKFPGFLIQGDTEPSHVLLDKCQNIYDTGAIVWVSPSMCTKRDAEVQAMPKDSHQNALSHRRLRLEQMDPSWMMRTMDQKPNYSGAFNAGEWHLKCATGVLGCIPKVAGYYVRGLLNRSSAGI